MAWWTDPVPLPEFVVPSAKVEMRVQPDAGVVMVGSTLVIVDA
jgi:hypothetical protein